MAFTLSNRQLTDLLDVLTRLMERSRAGKAGAPPTLHAQVAPPAPQAAAPAAPRPLPRFLAADANGLRGGQGVPAATALPAPRAAEPLNPNPTWSELIRTLERELGPAEWLSDRRKKKGMTKKEMLYSSSEPAFESKIWGPQTTKHLREAYNSLMSGDSSAARESFSRGSKAASPIMLDLNGDGKLGTTGVTTAKNRVDDQLGRTVDFDIDGDGDLDDVEWMDGQGDGMLVDDRDGGATAASRGDGVIDGKRLFGDQGGKYANGYDKLAELDKDGDGVIKGEELTGLKTWVDDGDAKLEAGELKTLAELGVTEISARMHTEKNARGEDLMRSSFVRDGQRQTTEDVWFGRRRA